MKSIFYIINLFFSIICIGTVQNYFLHNPEEARKVDEEGREVDEEATEVDEGARIR